MLRKLLFMVVFVAVLAMTVPAAAFVPKTDYSYEKELWWSGFGSDDLWTNSDNWWNLGVIPTSQDFASVGDPAESAQCTINSSMTAQCKVLFIGDWKPNSFITMTGGTLTVGTDLILGNRITGWGKGEGTLELTGGTVNIGDDIIISVEGTGNVNVKGGTLNAGGDLTMGAKGYMLISGSGQIIFDEDITDTVNSYIGAGQIYAPAGYEAVCEYLSDDTVITAQAVDPCRASNPSPRGPGIPVGSITLTWTAGVKGATAPDSHDVYYGSSYAAVRDANTSSPEWKVNQAGTSYPVSESLSYGDTRYWRIDEVYPGPDVVKGNVWNFTIAEYLTIEDWESYDSDTELRAVWSYGTSNATLYRETATYNADIIGSSQSLRMEYDNYGSPYLSEATKTYGTAQNYETGGTCTIAVYIHGLETNSDDNVYLALEDASAAVDSVAFPSQPALLQQTRESWHLWLTELSDFDVNTTQVKKITLGVGNKVSPAQGDAGEMYFEDVRLYPSACFAKTSPFVGRSDDGDLDNDCDVDVDDLDEFVEDWLDAPYSVPSATAPNSLRLVLHYKFDESAGTNGKDEVYNDSNHNATLNAASWAPAGGKYDGALDFTGGNFQNYALVPANAVDSDIMDEVTLSFWIKTNGQANVDEDACIFGHGGFTSFMPYNGSIQCGAGNRPGETKDRDDVKWGPEGGFSNTDYDYNQWNHIACVKSLSDGRTGTIKLYYNGQLVAKDSAQYPTKDDVNENNYKATIGCWYYDISDTWVTDGFFKGLLDDLRVYDYALSDAEVLSLAEKSSMSQPCVAIANISGDTKVDFADLAILASDWNSKPLWP